MRSMSATAHHVSMDLAMTPSITTHALAMPDTEGFNVKVREKDIHTITCNPASIHNFLKSYQTKLEKKHKKHSHLCKRHKLSHMGV